MGFFSRLFGKSPDADPEPARREPEPPRPAPARPAPPEPGNMGAKEAAQLARLLVSEIVLYNQEILEEARQRGNVYAALKGDIDGARKMYDKNVDPRSVDRDYLYLEMVASLARGNPAILGLPRPD